MIYIKDMDMPVDCIGCWVSCRHETYQVTGRPEGCPLEEAKTGDLINRTDAIEALRKKLQDWGGYAFEDYRRGLYEAQDILEALPSADAVSREVYEETDGVVTIEKQNAKEVGEIKHIVISSPNYTRYFYNESMPLPAEAVHKPDYSYEADMVKRLRQAKAVQGWIPFKKRPMTDEEKQEYPDWAYIFDCPLPDDEQEILLSNGKHVWRNGDRKDNIRG